MLEAFDAPGRFWRGNVHGHSTNSDGALTPEEAVARYRRQGYDFVSLTDHFLPGYNFPISDTRAFRTETFTTLLGAEVHAPATSRAEPWHIVAVGLPPDFPATGPTETGPTLARRCREAGAFVAIAHPHWYNLTLEDALTLDAAHAVEVYNHTCAIECDRGDGLVMLDALLSAGRRIDVIATDDSHWSQMDAFGAWVMVKAEENAPTALLDALKSGRHYATQGPEFHEIARDGDHLVIRCTAAANIILIGPAARMRTHPGQQVTHARLPLEPFAGGWCRAVVLDAAGKRAWSNPLWLEA